MLAAVAHGAGERDPSHLVCQCAVGSILARRARPKIKRESPLKSETRFFSETKSEGFDVKDFKEILRLRKQDKDEHGEHESLVAGRSRSQTLCKQKLHSEAQKKLEEGGHVAGPPDF